MYKLKIQDKKGIINYDNIFKNNNKDILIYYGYNCIILSYKWFLNPYHLPPAQEFPRKNKYELT